MVDARNWRDEGVSVKTSSENQLFGAGTGKDVLLCFLFSFPCGLFLHPMILSYWEKLLRTSFSSSSETHINFRCSFFFHHRARMVHVSDWGILYVPLFGTHTMSMLFSCCVKR